MLVLPAGETLPSAQLLQEYCPADEYWFALQISHFSWSRCRYPALQRHPAIVGVLMPVVIWLASVQILHLSFADICEKKYEFRGQKH
jgi:hypothetical protein